MRLSSSTIDQVISEYRKPGRECQSVQERLRQVLSALRFPNEYETKVEVPLEMPVAVMKVIENHKLDTFSNLITAVYKLAHSNQDILKWYREPGTSIVINRAVSNGFEYNEQHYLIPLSGSGHKLEQQYAYYNESIRAWRVCAPKTLSEAYSSEFLWINESQLKDVTNLPEWVNASLVNMFMVAR